MESLKILLVEDVAAEARLIRELIAEVTETTAGVTHAVNLEQGLDALRSDDLDVVLLDLSLPDSHGLETLQRVRSAAPHVAVVVLTGRDEENIALKAVEKGAQDFLVKGQVHGKAILRAIRYAIARARALEALRGSQRTFQETPDLLYIISPGTHEIDHLSPAMANLVGAGEGLPGTPDAFLFRELVHPDDLATFEQRMESLTRLPGPEVVESEFRVLSADGEWCWLHASETAFVRGTDGRVELLIGTAQLLHGRYEMEERMSAQITLLRGVLDALPEPILVESPGGDQLLANAAYRKMSQASRLKAPASSSQPAQGGRTPSTSTGKRREKQKTSKTRERTAIVDQSGEVIAFMAVGARPAS